MGDTWPKPPKSRNLLGFLVYVQITPENVGFNGSLRFPGKGKIVIKPGNSVLFEADTNPEFLRSTKENLTLGAFFSVQLIACSACGAINLDCHNPHALTCTKRAHFYVKWVKLGQRCLNLMVFNYQKLLALS